MPGCDFAGFDPFSGLDGCGNPLVPEDVYVYTACKDIMTLLILPHREMGEKSLNLLFSCIFVSLPSVVFCGRSC